MISHLLYTLTAHLPCRRIVIDGKPYLERYWVGRVFGITAYLHRFISADDERNVHDHPWGWSAAFVLCGGYLEERLLWMCPSYGWVSAVRRMFPGRVNVIRARDFHRITAPQHNTWTLFIHTSRIKGWAFLERHIDVKSVLYHQPLDVSAESNWQLTAPRGRYSKREPYREARR